MHTILQSKTLIDRPAPVDPEHDPESEQYVPDPFDR